MTLCQVCKLASWKDQTFIQTWKWLPGLILWPHHHCTAGPGSCQWRCYQAKSWSLLGQAGIPLDGAPSPSFPWGSRLILYWQLYFCSTTVLTTVFQYFCCVNRAKSWSLLCQPAIPLRMGLPGSLWGSGQLYFILVHNHIYSASNTYMQYNMYFCWTSSHLNRREDGAGANVSVVNTAVPLLPGLPPSLWAHPRFGLGGAFISAPKPPRLHKWIICSANIWGASE